MANIFCLGLFVLTSWILQMDNGIVTARNLSAKAIADIDTFIAAALNCRHIPGLSVAVVSKDQVLLSKGYGYADLEKNIPVTEHTLFPIASTTKAFTTAALAMILHETEFDWDTPLKKIYPKFKLHNDILTEHVTIRDILTHRTGIPGYFVALMAGYPEDMSMEEFIRTFNYHPPIHALRTQLEYNNFMYALAGFIAEILSNKSWKEIIQERIFKPLNMTSSTFVSNMNMSAELPGFAKPYVYHDSQNVAIDLTSIRQVEKASPAGSIITNAKDMAAWLQFHLRHGKLPSGDHLLSPESMEELYSTPIGGHAVFPPDLTKPKFPVSDISSKYALAWINNVYRGYHRIWHSGGILTYKAQVWLLPDLETGIFIVANGPGGRWTMVNIAQYITDHLAGEAPWLNTETVCTFPSPWKDDEPKNKTEDFVDDPIPHKLELYTGKFVNHAFGEIIIFQNVTDGRLHMKMGLFLEANLMYHKSEDIFVTKLINKYWYLNDQIPLEFKNPDISSKTFTSIYMPLCQPYKTALKLEFIRENGSNIQSGPEYTVQNSGITGKLSFHFIMFVIIAQRIGKYVV